MLLRYLIRKKYCVEIIVVGFKDVCKRECLKTAITNEMMPTEHSVI